MLPNMSYSNLKYSEYFKTFLPDHWIEKRLGYLSKQEKNAFVDGPFGSDLKTDDYQDEGVPLIQLNNIRDSKHILQNMKYISEEKKNQLIRHLALPNDIVIAKMAEPVARAAIVANYYSEYIIVADCVKLTPDDQKINLNYLLWAINSEPVKNNAELVSTGTTRIRINLGELQKLKIPYPTANEQEQIANFLDHETAKIDTLIEKQQQLIALLKEKRQAVISHAVTKGLNPDVKMKDSGVEWLGEVPEHWSLTKVAYIAKVINGSTPDKTNLSYWQNGTVPWLASSCLNQDRIYIADTFISNEATKYAGEMIAKNSLLVGLVGQGKTRGSSAILKINAYINQNVAAIIPYSDVEIRYLYYIFQTMYEDLRELGRGGNQSALNCEIIRAIKVPCPPLDERFKIAAYIDKHLEKFTKIELLAQHQIELLQERRTALISAAVTGKIDVRGWQPTNHAESNTAPLN